MVNTDKERRAYAAYALERIRELAREESLNYRSWRIEQDVINLGYSVGDVCQCIAALDDTHFHHSERPVGGRRWQDVYHCHWSIAPGHTDALYVKLMLTSSTITVELCSFHRSR